MVDVDGLVYNTIIKFLFWFFRFSCEFCHEMRLLRRTTKKEKKLKYLVIGLTVSIIVYYIYGSSKTIQNESNMKYILLWAPANRNELFKYIDQGQETFKMRKCPKSNCYLSDNKMLLNNVTKYDVIVFHGPDIFGNYNVLPPRRAPHQKYIFASRTSSEYCEAPDDNKFDGYFNWTWTYKINSDIPMGYITIRDSKGNVIGPRKEMHWLKMEEMSPVNDDVLDILNRKSVAVAWIASNCHTLSERELYVSRLNDELSKYDLELDIYGRCGKMLCPKFLMDHCLYAIQLDYYFYLAFENSFDDDYVTESLLHGLQNFAVPIVYGGANYTR